MPDRSFILRLMILSFNEGMHQIAIPSSVCEYGHVFISENGCDELWYWSRFPINLKRFHSKISMSQVILYVNEVLCLIESEI